MIICNLRIFPTPAVFCILRKKNKTKKFVSMIGNGIVTDHADKFLGVKQYLKLFKMPSLTY